ncbi:hypothetical protein [Amycolatopsis sp. 195334CR]|uniref:hypothetical protein n=1 Tax=Amycolatopsis sp. 195334CR TaxID=2814588 RepID=UPI001A8EC1BE|nr:hypothetical protein [Amycolatopsis sp. 195334CR]MBN6035619.1 hypothetical protein [Amycolatopsis sp. 195334CR]
MRAPIDAPWYHLYFGRTFVLDATPDGEEAGYLLNWDTGEFDRDDRPIDAVRGATSDSDIHSLSRERFIERTERIRADHLTGDGPIFELYENIHAMHRQRRAENRRLTDEEMAHINSLRRRTFAMWEEELARRAAGEPPSFTVRRRR